MYTVCVRVGDRAMNNKGPLSDAVYMHMKSKKLFTIFRLFMDLQPLTASIEARNRMYKQRDMYVILIHNTNSIKLMSVNTSC